MNYNDLKLTASAAPHIRTRSGTRQLMGEVLTALLPALGFAVFNFGIRALANVLISAGGCCVFELLYRAICKKDITAGDLSAAVTGVLIAFTCPVTTPYELLLLGDFFAIVLIKQLWGGIGKNLLNPALAARALLLFWSGKMSVTVGPRTSVPLWGVPDAVTSPTPMSLLRQNDLAGLQELYGLPEMLAGLTGGAVGEVCTLLLLLGGVYLIVRRVISWRIPVCYLGTAAVLLFLFPRGNAPADWMLYNLLGGGLVLAAFFMAADYATSPIRPACQMIYGAGCGALTVLFRYIAPGNEGICIAVLLMNLTARPLDLYLRPGGLKMLKKDLQELPSKPGEIKKQFSGRLKKQP
ncbi:MAG: RnfABCDGE type electron transport complex subunit D [Oscillospiraceae bacterium]|nr:RnfABCDGE type electron transport complex subunit D [Oscillospiraceae bacterium]